MNGSDACAITVIGLGNMGLPMALRLAEAGHAVHGFDRSREVVARFRAAGGADTAALPDAIAASAIVITMLPDGEAVRVALSEPAVRAALERRTPVVIDMSSSAPADTRTLGDELGKSGIALLDAPVSGGVPRARDGTLAIMVGGEAAVVAEVASVLAALGREMMHVGPLGAGHAMKALNNYVSACGLTAAAEAAIIGERFGISPAMLIEVLNRSTGRNNATENKFERYILNGRYDSGFLMRLMAKDIGIAAGLSAQINAALPLLTVVHRTWEAASATLGAAADHTEIYRYADEMAGGSAPGGPGSRADRGRMP